MNAFNLYEAYAAVYDEDLREDILSLEEDFEFIDELSDNELDQVMEEIIVEENLNINECFEIFDDFLIEARVTTGAGYGKDGVEPRKVRTGSARVTTGQGSVMVAKERAAARKQARKTKEKEERAQRRAERVERIKGSISRVAKKIGKKLTVGAEKAKRALQGRDSASERRVRQTKIKMRDVARKGIRKAVTGERGQSRPPAVTSGKTEKASSGDYTPPSKETVGKEVKTAAKEKIKSAPYRGKGVGIKEPASSGGIQSKTRSGSGEGPSSTGRALPPSTGRKGVTNPTKTGSQNASLRGRLRMAKSEQEHPKATVREDFDILAEIILEDLIYEGYAETFEEAFEILESFSDYEVGEIAEEYLTEETEVVNLYDVVLEHLLDEGYADTEEDAVVIMANMSEEWREEILDEAVKGSQRSIADRITGDDIRSVTGKGGKVKYSKPKWQDSVEARVKGGTQLRKSGERENTNDRRDRERIEANKKSITRLNAKPNTGSAASDGQYHISPGQKTSYYKEVPTDYRARKRRASGR